MKDTAQQGQQDACTPTPWELLGRDNPAGKALFKLYRADNLNGRATGLQYSQHNRQKIEKQLSEKAAAGTSGVSVQEPPTKIKTKVAVPHFRPKSSDAEVDNLAQLPHRRQGEQIMAELAREQEKARGFVPMPSGRLIDEQEKQRCALLMQYKGKVPAELLSAANGIKSGMPSSPAATAGCYSTGGSSGSSGSSNTEQDSLRGRRQALQQRFTEASDEVAERETFISSMQQLGQLKMDHLNVVKAEVASKVREMNQLDIQIKELDRQLSTRMHQLV